MARIITTGSAEATGAHAALFTVTAAIPLTTVVRDSAVSAHSMSLDPSTTALLCPPD